MQKNSRKNKIIYLAGILDGEGCFNFIKVKNTLCPRILVTNTDIKLLNFLKDNFGGDYSITKVRGKDNWKPRGMWRLSNQNALDLANEVFDYLIIKDGQALLFRVFDEARKLIKPKDRYNVYLYLSKEMSKLNKKGLSVAKKAKKAKKKK